MLRIQKILAPTDFSELSKFGLRYALEVARNAGAEVIVYYVIDSDTDWQHRRADTFKGDLLINSRRALDKFLTYNFADCIDLVEVRQMVEFGAPDKNIVEIAASEAVDMIVMSTHGRTGFDHFIVGSIAEKVVARAPCPVLIVPQPWRERTNSKAA